MTDERLSAALRTWLQQRDEPPDDPTHTAAHVLARLPGVRQRRRWWLPALGLGGRRAGGVHTSGPWFDASPVERFPIVARRTAVMLSPVKAVTVGALALALTSIYLVGQQPLQQPPVAPGAEMTEPPVAVAVAQECADIFASPVVCSWTAADSRLAGTMTHQWSEPGITATLLDDEMGVNWANAYLEGPDGDWAGHLYAVWADPAQLFVILSGEGAYGGWQFVGSTIDTETPGTSTWTGVMYQGDPPPFGLPVEATAG